MEFLLLGYILGCLLNEEGQALLKPFDYVVNPERGILLRFRESTKVYTILVDGLGPMEASQFEQLKHERS